MTREQPRTPGKVFTLRRRLGKIAESPRGEFERPPYDDGGALLPPDEF